MANTNYVAISTKSKLNKGKSPVNTKAIIQDFKDTPFASLSYWEDKLISEGLDVQNLSKHNKSGKKTFLIST